MSLKRSVLCGAPTKQSDEGYSCSLIDYSMHDVVNINTAESSHLFILAGPNGAGKSTTARVLLPRSLGVTQFVNADNIALGLSPFAPETAVIQAGRLMLRRIKELLQNRESLGFETTLAGRNYVRLIEDARANGYVVNLIYVYLRSPNLAITRVADRVRQGGHDVPTETIRRRYYRGLANFFGRYRSLANSWTLCDNSDRQLIVVAQSIEGDELIVHDPCRYQEIQRAAENADNT